MTEFIGERSKNEDIAEITLHQSQERLLTNRPKKVEIPLHHVQQRLNWDCGLACFMMILNQQQREYFYKNFNEICQVEGFGTSVWTIDLAYLLKRFGISFTYYTITLGADPGYSSESYYSKVMVTDETRVNQRFHTALEQQIMVEKRSLKLSEILLHLSFNNPAIVLVNDNLLTCDDCEQIMYHGCRCKFLSCGCFSNSLPYHGHFVTLCGYDMDQQKVLYRNPTYNNKVCFASFESFEAARHSYGTDEDIILIKHNIRN